MTTKYTKPAQPNSHPTPETPVFPKEIHQTRPPVAVVLPHQKPAKRDNVFSQSKDIREDRDSRQIKNSQSNQSLPHGH